MSSFYYEGEVYLRSEPYEGTDIELVDYDDDNRAIYLDSILERFTVGYEDNRYTTKLGKLRILIEKVDE